MKLTTVLALETSGMPGSVAVLRGPQVLAAQPLPGPQRTVQTLAPSIQAVLQIAEVAPAAVDVVAVTHGPGSFTGLRLGVISAKCFAWAVQAQLVAVDTLEVIAFASLKSLLQGDVDEMLAAGPIPPALGGAAEGGREPGAAKDFLITTTIGGRIAVAIDAQRGQVYAAEYVFTPEGQWQTVAPTAIVDQTAWLASLAPGSWVSGPALAKLAPQLPPGVQVAPQSCWEPQAAALAQLGAVRATRGEVVDPLQLVPAYYRLSAAEEKRAAR